MGGKFDLKTACSSDAFITEPGSLTEDLLASVKEVTGVSPELSTTGGTSDARFIRKYGIKANKHDNHISW